MMKITQCRLWEGGPVGRTLFGEPGQALVRTIAGGMVLLVFAGIGMDVMRSEWTHRSPAPVTDITERDYFRTAPLLSP